MTEIEKYAYMAYPRFPSENTSLPDGMTKEIYAYRQMKKRRIFISGANQMKEIAIRQAVSTYGISGVNWDAKEFEKTLREAIDRDITK